jgi:hypothetical protein
MLAKVVMLATAFKEDNGMDTINIRDDSSSRREAGTIHQGHQQCQQDLTTRIWTLVGMTASETNKTSQNSTAGGLSKTAWIPCSKRRDAENSTSFRRDATATEVQKNRGARNGIDANNS